MILPVSQQPKVLESIKNGGEIDSERFKRLIKTKNERNGDKIVT